MLPTLYELLTSCQEPTRDRLEFERQVKLAKRRDYMKKWYANLPPDRKKKIIAQSLAYLKEHPEKKKKYKRNWLARHLQEHRNAACAYYWLSREKILEHKRNVYSKKRSKGLSIKLINRLA